MTAPYPRTHYACPCSDLTSAPLPSTNKRASFQPTTIQLDHDQAFNSHSPRADFALYPLDHLLYCDECDAIRCPRCWTEEVIYWYCPSCLFEVPSSAVRGDGNRCARSCYTCPSCTAQLAVTQITTPREEGLLKPSDAAGGNDAYILQCQYCAWSSLEINVHFSKSTKITEQLSKFRKARTSPAEPNQHEEGDKSILSHDDLFTNLATFYKDQLGGSGDVVQNPYSNSPYSSPANLARIMSLYGGLPYNALKKSREKPQPMREALQKSEGLSTYSPSSSSSLSSSDSDAALIHQMQHLGWDGTTSPEQRNSAPANSNAKFTSQLWPAATQLRTRRGRRCRTCRQFLTRPEQKVGSMKYKIRLLAVNYMPRLSIRPLQAHSSSTTTPAAAAAATTTTMNTAFQHSLLRGEEEETVLLKPHQTKQYILTIRNPIFENVRISLATSGTTPGRIASRVTILCPSFTVGPAGEIWDDALASSSTTTSTSASDPAGGESGGGGRSAAMASLTGTMTGSASGDMSATSGGNANERQPEAGKIWEKTRNSTSVIVEIVPGALPDAAAQSIVPKTHLAEGDDGADADLEEDDDVLEVPVYVRAEWETDAKPGDSSSGLHGRSSSSRGGEKGEKADGSAGVEKVRKELGYWVVLAVGRIAS